MDCIHHPACTDKPKVNIFLDVLGEVHESIDEVSGLEYVATRQYRF